MHRRDIVKLLGLILLGCGSSTLVGTGESLSTKKRTLVIGAGLAGLAAAKELKRHGHEVVILEARDRIGGRIWTSHKWQDLPLDLGASWIHGIRGNPINDLAEQVQATRQVTSYEKSAFYNTNGPLLTVDEMARLEDIRNRVFRALRNAQNRDPDVSVRQAALPLTQQFHSSAEDNRLLNFVLNSEIEQEWG
ncbi:MAG: FAD-dependent oxidoreductase, partial [Cyanophyceae cyanobacterium]